MDSHSPNSYPIKSETDHLVDSLSNGNPYPNHYPQWNPQIQHSPAAEYGYPYPQAPAYTTSTPYADTTMYQPQPSPTTDSNRQGNPVSVPVAISAPLNSLGYSFGPGSSSAYPPASTPNGFSSVTISRPPSVVHSPHQDAFASRARSTSYSGPYFMAPGFSPSSYPHPMARLTMMSPTTLDAPSSTASTPYEYMQEANSPTAGNGQYKPAMYTYTSMVTPPPPPQAQAQQQQQQHQSLPPPIPPLASSVATGGAPTIPRSMSMGNIPGGGLGGGNSNTNSPAGTNGPWFSGRTTPSGVLTPGSALSRSTVSRLGVMPSLAIPSGLFQEHRSNAEYDSGYPGSNAVSPTGPVVLSSYLRSSGVGSGPGTASNGGSVPLTPTTDEAVHFEYHPFAQQHHSAYSRNGGSGAGNDVDEDDEDDDEDEKMTMAAHSHMGSPRRGVGVTRTAKKRRSTTIAAGPSAAAVGVTRSRSGTMISGPASTVVPTNGLSGGSLTMSPVDMHGSAAGLGMGILGSSSTTAGSSGPGTPLGGQANSPLAMKELSPAHKPMIENYLNRYLNYLCMNPNAKDRMGHQIHQMYTARRIQRYEQLYGWRPLKFRIEAFVNGFVDLLTASGLSQDVTMKIPHYLNNSRLFSRFNESGNRMKSQGQTIWRVRARCRNDIPNTDVPAPAVFHHPGSNLSQQQHHHQQQQQQHQHDAGLMMAPDPLLWEFLPYERSIVGQPPLAIVGTAWQWNMKVHDHWTPRKKVNWSFVSNTTSNSSDTGLDGSDSSSPLSASAASSSSSGALPKWLSLQGSKLKGTPTEPGVYPVSIEASFQEDNDPEPVVVRGNYTIQVSKAIGGWKTKLSIPQEGMLDSPEGEHASGSGEAGYGNDIGSGRGFSGGASGSADGMDDVFPSSVIGERTDQLLGMYDPNQGPSSRSFHGYSYSYGPYVH